MKNCNRGAFDSLRAGHKPLHHGMSGFIAFIALLSLTGCGLFSKYGTARPSVNVTLESEPDKATAYLIPPKLFDSPEERTALLADPRALEDYRVKEGLTPVTTKALPYRYYYLAVVSGRTPTSMRIDVVAPSSDVASANGMRRSSASATSTSNENVFKILIAQ
ncbi:MAG: hypothetical protein IPH13_09135 [Planctomycetes bacterium]|nr:hypothetical protein [Planctomycetota bacterium]MCC7171698.1 hypothetical protein [Planctomycetota bacterium]